MTIKDQLIGVLREGPSLPREVACELGMDSRFVSNHLCGLYRRGHVSRRPFHDTDASSGTLDVRLYMLKEHGDRRAA